MAGIVAAFTGQAGVPSFQRISGLFVIEGFYVPLDQREIFSVVLGVAMNAALAVTWSQLISRVQSLVRNQPRSNLGVAFEALVAALTP